jgi:GNAT superfamily N-acetyltransferase
MKSRAASDSDIDAATETIRLAFCNDPVWSIALSRPDGRDDHLMPYWQRFIEGAMRYGTVFVADNADAVSVWLPPGGTELSDEQHADQRALAIKALGQQRAAALFELWDRFESTHPDTEPHYYLSLLGTHPRAVGHGVGQALLGSDLSRFDAEGVPSFLESSNTANDHRYERAGFKRIGVFRTVLDDAPVSQCWRPVGG